MHAFVLSDNHHPVFLQPIEIVDKYYRLEWIKPNWPYLSDLVNRSLIRPPFTDRHHLSDTLDVRIYI